MNSSSLISPSPSRSASSIISWISSSAMFSPSSLATRLRLWKLILPVSSSSKSLKAFIISSRGSLSAIFWVIISMNSGYSMTPDPSLSTSAIIFLISSRGLESESSHGDLEFLLVDVAGTIGIKEVESLLDFLFLLFG